MTRQRYDLIKRLIDLQVAAVALVLTAPVQVAIALLVRRRLGPPVLFRQQRPGRDGVPFTLLKFRSMRDVDPAKGLITDADRITAFGTRLRASSLDELPSLWNVLRGDMSLVGPRPLLMQYLSRYTPEQARRHEVRPGITGLAQVTGRNLLTWEDKFRADVYYVDHRSLGLDMRIMGATVRAILRPEGIAADGEVTMPEFRGAS
jgi:lipopolysaccharide/colanic/teichoic acid biosynthesis glycosyltransferase